MSEEQSPRAQAAMRIRAFIDDWSNGIPARGPAKVPARLAGKKYAIPFEAPHAQAGLVCVYSEKYFHVRFMRGPRRISRVFESETDALQFFRLAVVEDDWVAASQVPCRDNPQGGKNF